MCEHELVQIRQHIALTMSVRWSDFHTGFVTILNQYGVLSEYVSIYGVLEYLLST